MNVFIDVSLTTAERNMLFSDIGLVFGQYNEVRSEDDKPVVRIVSMGCFETIKSDYYCVITPNTVRCMKCKGIRANGFIFPKTGLANLHLYNKRISFTGFDSFHKKKMKSYVEFMGGMVDSVLTKSCDYLIAKSSSSRRVQYAKNNGIPIICASWIDNLYFSSDYIVHESFFIKPLTGVRFSIFGKFDKNLRDIITSNGGRISDSLTTKTTHVLFSEGGNPAAYRIALDRRIPFVTDSIVMDSIKKQLPLSEVIPPLVMTSVFKGLLFSIHESLFADVKKMITENGGNVVSVEKSNIFITMDPYDGRDCRTPMWIERCVESGRIIDLDSFPLYIPQKPYGGKCNNFVISVSGFRGDEYLDIVSSIRWLGAVFSPQLRMGCSFLISCDMNSNKSIAAKEKNIPIFSKEVLISLYEQGNKCDLSQISMISSEKAEFNNAFLSSDNEPVIDEQPIVKTNQEAVVNNPESNPKNKFIYLSDSDYDDIEIIENVCEIPKISNPKETQPISKLSSQLSASEKHFANQQPSAVSFLSSSDDDEILNESYANSFSYDSLANTNDSIGSNGSKSIRKDVKSPIDKIKAPIKLPKSRTRVHEEKMPSEEDIITFTQTPQGYIDDAYRIKYISNASLVVNEPKCQNLIDPLFATITCDK